MKPRAATRRPAVAALALFGLLAVSVLSAASMQRASALEAITFTTKDTLSSQNTLFQQVYESSTGPDYVTFLDATGSGTYNRQHYSNYALQFNGSDEYAQAGANTVFDITTGDASFWGYLYPTSVTGGDLWIVTKLDHGAATNDGYTVIRRNANLYVEFGDGTASRVSIEVSSAFTINTWHAWGVSFDRDGNMRGWVYNLNAGTYVTGSASIAGQQASASNAQTFTVARRSDAASGYLPGAMDQIYAAMGTAISQTQFLEFAQSGSITGLTATSAYYFNEGSGSTAYDEIASNNLTLQNSPAYVSNTPTNSISTVAPAATTTLSGSGNTINSAAYMGPVDLSRYSLSFAGTNQYVAVTSSSDLNPTTALTIAGWVKWTSNADYQLIIAKRLNGGGSDIQYNLDLDPTGHVEWGVGTGASFEACVTTGAISAGSWYHLAVTYDDAANSLKVYINGVLEKSCTTTITIGTTANDLRVGYRQGNDIPFKGNLDEIFFYKNVAKDASQIASIYAGTLDTTGLVAWWDFNDGVGTSAKDRMGSNTGTLTNTPTWSSDVTTNSLSRPTSYITGRDTATGNNGYGKINLSDLSEVADGYQTSSYYPRNIAQSTTSLYSPLYDNTANGNMRLGIQTRALGGYSEPSIYTGSAGNPAHGVIMDTSSAGSSAFSVYGASTNAVAEYAATSSSALIGKKIDRITLYLSKSNSPTGTATIGWLDSSNNVINSCGTQDVSLLTGSATAYTYLCASPRVVQEGDRIGIKYTGGDVTNSLQVTTNNANPYDGTNSILSIYSSGSASWDNSFSAYDVRGILADTSNVKIAVYDGSPDTEYVFFESGASSLAVVKYTNAASTISTSLSHTAGKDYSIMQMSGKILIQTSDATYTLTTSTDAITTDSNTYLTRPPQTFSISPSARTYISAAYVANEETATLWNPSAGTSASDYVMIDTASAPTLTAYNPPKYYYLQTNDLTVEAASLTGTSWTIKQPGTQENITVTPYTEKLGIALVQNNTIFDENVIMVNCDNGNYDVSIPYFAVGSDADCIEWWTYDVQGNPAARHLPYATTIEPVHANEYTYYTFTLSVADPTVYSLTTIYGGKDVDNADFDSSGQLQQRLLYQQCYTINVEEILTGNSVQTGNVCAGDDTTKTISLSGIVIPPDWLGTTWSHTVQRNFTYPGPTNNGILYSVQKSTTPYNASIHIVDHPDSSLATYDAWFNFTNALGISVSNVTGINSNQTLFFTVYENGVIVINDVSSGMGSFYDGELDGFGLLFGVPIAVIFPILTAALFPKNQSHIGIIVTGAVIGILQFFGFFASIPFNEGMWGVAFGLIAIGVMLGSRR